jgi:bacteriorhodopsin
MTKATLTKKTFKWCWLTVSEVQSIIVMVGSMAASSQTVLEKELRVLHLDLQVAEGDYVLHWVA